MWREFRDNMSSYILLIIFLILVILSGLLSGCANIRIKRTMPDGSTIEAEYTRWFNQNVEGLMIETPEGYKFGFEKQNSEVPTINLNLNGLKISNEVPTN